MTDSTPHSELREAVLAGIQDGYNEGEDEFDCSAETRCGSCVGCEAEAALSSLSEQMNLYEDLIRTLPLEDYRFRHFKKALDG